MNTRKYFIYLFILLVLSVAAVLFWLNTKVARQGNLWQMLPNTPALVLQTDHAGNFLEKLENNNEIIRGLVHTPGFEPLSKQLKFADSILHLRHQWVEKFNNSEFFAALYPGESQLLFLLYTPRLPRIETIKNFLETSLGKPYVVLYNHPGNFPVTTIKIYNTHTGKSYWLWKMGGALLFTARENLMEASISGYSLQEMHFSDSKNFNEVAKTSGKLVDARLFVYYPVLGQFLSGLVNEKFKDIDNEFAHFAEWSETDLIIGSQDIVFSGYTKAGANSLLERFSSQQPVSSAASTLFPFNTTFSISKEFSDYLSFCCKKTVIKRFKTRYQTDVSQIIELTGNDISLVSNALNSKELPHKTWAIIRLKDVQKANKILRFLALKSKNSRVYHTGNYTIGKIGIPHFLSKIYGKTFSVITQNYYCIINGFAVFGNSPAALSNLIHYYQTGKTLDLDVNYKTFSNNLANTSNLLYQFQIRTLTGFSNYFLNRKTDSALLNYKPFLKNIQGIAFQFSKDANLFYTNFYLRYNKTFREENLALWKTKLNAPVVGRPFLVKDHKSNKYDIIVFDRDHYMYLIDPNGKILWTKQLSELPMSPIYPVDYYKNGKIQYLFNTKNELFLIDRKGQFVARYPIAVHPPATNGLSLFDYTHRKDYRILLAQADKRIYDYSISGNEVKGWRKPRMQDIVTQKVVRLLANGKDYIIINDDKNHVKIVNRRGRQRIYLKAPVNKARHSSYFVNKTNNKGIILTTNTSGKLVYISTKGKLRYTDFGHFSPDHYFLYDDFNGDGYKDFIFVDKNRLEVFDRFKKVLFSYKFNENITVQPEFFSLGDRQKVLGIVASKEKTIYLFDSKGNILINHGLTGETPFTVGSLNNNNEVNIVTATGSTLYNYRIK